jgi:hypothetical protein
VPPTIRYNYEERIDVPNPHNYWDNEPTLSVKKEKALEEKVTVEAKETSMAVPVSPVMDKQLPDIASEETPPKSCMPSWATFASQPPLGCEEVYRKASSGDAISSEAEMLTNQFEQLEKDVHAQNNYQEFNIQSVKQVLQVLFGEPGHPTNKMVQDT